MYFFERKIFMTNLHNELEAIRKRLIDNLNSEFDLLSHKLSECETTSSENDEPYDIEYSLKTGVSSFKGRKPTAVIFSEQRIPAKSWKNVVEIILKEVTKDNNYTIALYSLCGKISGKKRMLLDMTANGMRSPMKISDNLYLETHYDTETLIKILTNKLLNPIGYDYEAIKIAVKSD